MTAGANGAQPPKGSLTLKLKEPIVFGSDKISEITFRRPKGKEMRAMPADTSTTTIGIWLDFASELSEHPPSVFDELDGADALEVVGLVAGFVAPGQATGGTSSASSRRASAGAPKSS